MSARNCIPAALQRTVSVEEAKAKAQLGLAADAPLKKGQRLPVTAKLKRLYAQVRALHGKVARQRHDFYHKLTAELVKRFAFLGTEALAVNNMSRAAKAKPDPDQPGAFLPNGAAAKAGLNRSILDAAPSMLLGMLRTKAAEAASVFAVADTRKVKPTQRFDILPALSLRSPRSGKGGDSCWARPHGVALRWVLASPGGLTAPVPPRARGRRRPEPRVPRPECSSRH